MSSTEHKTNNYMKLIMVVSLIVLGFIMASMTGLIDNLKNIAEMQIFFKSFGIWGYLVFILVYIGSSIFMLPGSMLTVIAGVVFGPLIGGVIALVGATIGASLSFLLSKYFVRSMIEDKFMNNKMFKMIDDGVEQNGTSFLILTRLVPVFPFAFQNYAYGLTKIELSTFFIISFICMAPGTFIYAYMAGEIVLNGFSISLLVKFAAAGIVLFLLSLIPRYIAKKKGIDMDSIK